MNTYKKSSYTNTLFFTIFNALLSVALIIMLYFGLLKNTWIWAIVIIEVGIVFIIGLCVTKMIKYEKYMVALTDPKNMSVRFDNCPDYYVRKLDKDSSEVYCSNEYTVTSDNNEYTMKVYPDNVDLPPSLAQNSGDNVDKHERFWLKEIENAQELPSIQEKCAVLTSEPSHDALAKYKGYSDVPWTSVQNQCLGLFASL
jgi:hypothetical protein